MKLMRIDSLGEGKGSGAEYHADGAGLDTVMNLILVVVIYPSLVYSSVHLGYRNERLPIRHVARPQCLIR